MKTESIGPIGAIGGIVLRDGHTPETIMTRGTSGLIRKSVLTLAISSLILSSAAAVADSRPPAERPAAKPLAPEKPDLATLAARIAELEARIPVMEKAEAAAADAVRRRVAEVEAFEASPAFKAVVDAWKQAVAATERANDKKSTTPQELATLEAAEAAAEKAMLAAQDAGYEKVLADVEIHRERADSLDLARRQLPHARRELAAAKIEASDTARRAAAQADFDATLKRIDADRTKAEESLVARMKAAMDMVHLMATHAMQLQNASIAEDNTFEALEKSLAGAPAEERQQKLAEADRQKSARLDALKAETEKKIAELRQKSEKEPADVEASRKQLDVERESKLAAARKVYEAAHDARDPALAAELEKATQATLKLEYKGYDPPISLTATEDRDFQCRLRERSRPNFSLGTSRTGARRLPEVRLHDVALPDAVDFLRDVSGLNVLVDWKSLESAGVKPSSVVECSLRNVPMVDALREIAKSVAGEKNDHPVLAWLDGPYAVITTDAGIATWKAQLARLQQLVAGDAKAAQTLRRRLPEMKLDNVGLGDTLDFFRDVTGLKMEIDWKGLEAAGVAKDTPIVLRLYNVPAGDALLMLLRSADPNDRIDVTLDGETVRIGKRG